MKHINNYSKVIFVTLVAFFLVACGSSSEDPNERVAGEFIAATFLTNVETLDSLTTVADGSLHGDGTGSATFTYSDGNVYGPEVVSYNIDSTGAGVINSTAVDGQIYPSDDYFTPNNEAFARFDKDPNDNKKLIGIGLGIQPDHEVESISGEYHTFIIYNDKSKGFDVSEHVFFFNPDGTGSITLANQSANFTYLIDAGKIVITFAGSAAHDPISAYITKNGNYLVAADLSSSNNIISIQMFVKSGAGMTASRAKGLYSAAILLSQNGATPPAVVTGTMLFDGKSSIMINPDSAQAMTGSYEIMANGQINMLHTEVSENSTGWISPDGELIVLVNRSNSDNFAAVSLITKQW